MYLMVKNIYLFMFNSKYVVILFQILYNVTYKCLLKFVISNLNNEIDSFELLK